MSRRHGGPEFQYLSNRIVYQPLLENKGEEGERFRNMSDRQP